MGLPKSDFTALTTIEDGSTFDFVINGQNFKITKANLLTALGVTGTLSQTGPVTAVPVLDLTSAPDYLIRNLVAGDNISIAVGPENGIVISTAAEAFNKQNFSANGTINSETELAISTGTNTLIMPTTHIGVLEVKSISGTVTLDPGSNTIENGNTVSTTANRRFNLDGTVWIEL